MGLLKLKVYKTGRGDCILVVFPEGKLGLIDSNVPPGMEQCPAYHDIIELGGELEFVCLTHPHGDHFSGLLSILEAPDIEVSEFWHSMSLGLENTIGLGRVLDFINKFSVPKWANTEFIAEKMKSESKEKELFGIFDYVYDKSIKFDRRFSEYQMLESIDGVEIMVLSPSTKAFNRYERAILKARRGSRDWTQTARSYYANRISLALHLIYRHHRIILAGDIMEANWREITEGARRRRIWKKIFPTVYLKAPHHGSEYSFDEAIWSSILCKDGIIVVSDGSGVHLSDELANAARTRDWQIYCTDKGESCKSAGHIVDRYLPEVHFVLDQVSAEDIDTNCYGCIEVEFPTSAKPRIKTEFSPQPESLFCR